MASADPAKDTRARFELLDVCRFVAAFAVLIYHWLFKGIETGTMDTVSYSPVAGIAAYGYLGVYFFFMISGFVIANSTHGRTASYFAVRRMVRLYPAFWASMLITAGFTALIGGTIFNVTIPQVLANLTMVPQLLDQPLVDRVYWTLFCEILFYGMVFIILLAGMGRYLNAFFPAWALVMLAVAVLAPQFSRHELIGSLYAFFAAGAIISTIQRRGWSAWQAVGLSATLYVTVQYTIEQTVILNDGANGPYTQSVPLTVGVIVAFFAVMLLQITPRVAAWKIPHSRMLGALTYPVYLLHAHIGYMLFNHFATDNNKWVVFTLTLAFILSLSYAVHRLVERAPQRMWVAFFDGTAGRMLRVVERALHRIRDRRNPPADPTTIERPQIHPGWDYPRPKIQR